MQVKFKLLGTGSGMGAPSFFCKCDSCKAAFENKAYGRTRNGAIVQVENRNNILIDLSPDLGQQLVREQVERVDAVFLTHWHYANFAGIGEIGPYVNFSGRGKIPLFLPASAVEAFKIAFSDFESSFKLIAWQFDQEYAFPSVTIKPILANHGIETAGFLIETKSKKLAYFPSTAGLSEHSRRKVVGVDWLVCDATFGKENPMPQEHMRISETIELGRMVRAQNTVLTHLSSHYIGLENYLKLEDKFWQDDDIIIAADGMVFSL
jgi:phosphoribosyl 1,2-cyclic phosphate phosphodiesterase